MHYFRASIAILFYQPSRSWHKPIKTHVVQKTNVKNPIVKAAKTKQNAKFESAINTWTVNIKIKTSNNDAGYYK